MGYLTSLRGAMLALRAGEIDFGALARAAEPLIRRRAAYLQQRWRKSQDLYGDDDLYQEMMLALWESTLRWDPARTEDPTRFADVQVQRAARERLRKAAGYPDARRSRPMRRVDVAAARGPDSGSRRVEIEAFEYDVDELGASDAEQEVGVLISELLSRFPEGLEHAIAHAVLVEGQTPEEAAARVYANPRLRLRWRLYSEEHAIAEGRRVIRAIRETTTAIAADADR